MLISITFIEFAYSEEKGIDLIRAYPEVYSTSVEAFQNYYIGVSIGEEQYGKQVFAGMIGQIEQGIELNAEHPDWTVEDIILQVKNTADNPLFNDLAEKKKALFLEIKDTNINLADSKKIVESAGLALLTCMEAVNDMPPTKRPSDPIEDCAVRVKKWEYTQNVTQ